MRRQVKPVQVGNITLGVDPIAVQSMLSVPSTDIPGNVAQAKALAQAGCEILRVALPDRAAVALIPAIKEAVSVPLVADIHFDARLALEAVAAGVDKIRLNPGNIGSPEKVRAVARACREKGVPIRVGVNSGSVEPALLQKFGGPTPEAMVESALSHVRLLEQADFNDIVISIKASHVPTMLTAYRLLAEQVQYPLHLGVTEAGTQRMGLIKSAMGIGSLLCDGIGDTIRVSLTADPVEEVTAAYDILRAAGVRACGPQLVSCPTCGRTRIDLVGLANRVEEALKDCKKNIRVAVMGCAVNGPGEAREADVGIAGGDGCGVLFRKGVILCRLPEEELLPALLREIEKL